MTGHYIPSRSAAVPALYDADNYDDRLYDYIVTSSSDLIEFGAARAFVSTPPPAVANQVPPVSGANP